MLLRNGEQLLLTVVIPTLLLVLFSAVDIVDTGAGKRGGLPRARHPGARRDVTAFTGQAIATGFERRYGVLKRLGASPLPRWGLMAAKTCSVLVTEVLQVVLLTVIALRAGLVAARQPVGGAAPAAARHRGLLRARAADGGHAEGGGDAGRRQPGLPPAAGGRRRDRAAGQVPGRRAGRAGAAADLRPLRRAAGRAPARGRDALGRPGRFWRCGRCWGWAPRHGSSAGSERLSESGPS